MNLLSVQGTGVFWTFCIFLICVVLVHAFCLARLGWRTVRKKLPPEKPKPKEPEQIYYLVEKKKKRAKTEYEKPKPFRFKDQSR